jgi:hypothetical protein
MPPIPTPDPSASLTPWQTYTVAWHDWAGNAAQLGIVAVAAGLTFAIVALFIIATVVSWRSN